MYTKTHFNIINEHIFFSAYKDILDFISTHSEAKKKFDDIINTYETTRNFISPNFKGENKFSINDTLDIYSENKDLYFDFSIELYNQNKCEKQINNSDYIVKFDNSLKLKISCFKEKVRLFWISFDWETTTIPNTYEIKNFLSMSYNTLNDTHSNYIDVIHKKQDKKIDKILIHSIFLDKKKIDSTVISEIKNNPRNFFSIKETSFLNTLNDKQITDLIVNGKVDQESVEFNSLLNDSNFLKEYIKKNKNSLLYNLNKQIEKPESKLNI